MRGRTFLVAAAVLAGVAAIAACGEGGSSSSSSGGGASNGSAGVNLGAAAAKVSATDQLQFSPTSLSVNTGDIVQWTNTGSTTHTVTFDSASSLSDPSLAGGSTWQVKFTSPGSYAYHCTIHAGMTGTITVK